MGKETREWVNGPSFMGGYVEHALSWRRSKAGKRAGALRTPYLIWCAVKPVSWVNREKKSMMHKIIIRLKIISFTSFFYRRKKIVLVKFLFLRETYLIF